MKRRIRLSESTLYRIIKESVKSLLREDYYNPETGKYDSKVRRGNFSGNYNPDDETHTTEGGREFNLKKIKSRNFNLKKKRPFDLKKE